MNAGQRQASNQTIKTIKTWSSLRGKTREVPHLHNVYHGRIHSHIFSAVPHLPVSQQFYPDSGVLPEPCFSLCRSNRHIRGLFPRQIELQRLTVLRLVLLLFVSWRSLGQTHRRRGYTSSYNRPRRHDGINEHPQRWRDHRTRRRGNYPSWHVPDVVCAKLKLVIKNNLPVNMGYSHISSVIIDNWTRTQTQSPLRYRQGHVPTV